MPAHLEELDESGHPLMGGDSHSAKEGRPISNRDSRPCCARCSDMCSCWRDCHMSIVMWITLVLFATICTLGYFVLHGNTSASTDEYPRCNRLYSWVFYWVIFTLINTVWFVVEEGFRVPDAEIDATYPGGVRITPIKERNSTAFVYLRYFRLTVSFVITVVFFVLGWELLTNNQCTGHRDLLLYFRVLYYIILVSYCLAILVALCFSCVACCAAFSSWRAARRISRQQQFEPDGSGSHNNA